MTDLAQGTTSHVGFQLKDDLLIYKGRLVIPHSSSFVPMILAEFHSSLIGGHSAETKMYQRIAYIGWACIPILLNLWLSPTYASETRGSTQLLQVFYNRSPFLFKYGMKSSWTLLRVCPKLRGILLSWLRLTV